MNFAMAEDAGHFRYVKGVVLVGERVATKGQVFSHGDLLATKKDSMAIVTLNDGSTIKLNENTTIAVDHLSNDLGPTKVTLGLGSVVVNALKSALKNNLKEKFILKTKSVAMGVRGTTFFASFGKQGSSDIWMCVNEGTVAIRSSVEKEAKLVNAGEGVQVKNGEKTSKPTPLVWTKKLNWNLSSESDADFKDTVNIEEAYTNPLDFNYE
ncbi:MAG: FecR domain-containing protein [Rhizobacter sp.]|nr:FecR domain-containing protein [Bacteriovorax sp.]